MKVCVFGAGAVGGHIAARLCAANHEDISVIARGAHLEAIRKNGLLLKCGKEEIRGKPRVATDDPKALPKQDVLIVTLKAHVVPDYAAVLEQLLAPNGVAAFPLNGLTWWWRVGNGPKEQPLPLLDPQGELWNRLRERTIGCVVYSPNEIESPGVILHIGANRWIMGEPSDKDTERVRAVVDLFNKSGLNAEVSPDIRAEVLRKLMANAPRNTLAALTRLGHHEIASDPDLKAIAACVMRETLEVAAKMGWDLRHEIDVEKLASSATPGRMSQPSMLQDVLLGRQLEVEAHIGQTQAFGRELGMPTPTIDTLLPLLRGLDRSIRAAANAKA